MKTKLFLVALLALVVVSCKKADPNKALSVVGAENTPAGGGGGSVAPFTTASKTILTSTTAAINNLVVTNGRLYLLGSFNSLGSTSSRCIVAYDGSSFSTVSNDLLAGSTLYTAEYFNNSRLLIGGYFTTSSSSSARNFGYISTAGYVTGYSGVTGYVYAMEDMNSNCYMGGMITTVNSVSKNCAYYSSSYSLFSYGSAMSSSGAVTNCMAGFDGKLFMGGTYTGTSEKNIVYGSGSSWIKSGDGFSNSVYDLQEYGGRLYAGGSMYYDGNYNVSLNYVNSIANYNDVWQKTGTNNLPTTCKSLEVHGGNLIAACNNGSYGFLYSYNTSTNSWSNCMTGSQTYYRLDKIASFNGKLYGIEKNTSTGITSFVRFD